MLSSKLHSSIGNTDRLYVDDVFSAYTYAGNGSTQAVNNGIDLVGNGGLVWVKSRNTSDSGGVNLIFDTTASSPFLYLVSNTTAGRAGGSNNFQSFNANGFTLGPDFPNWSGRNLISWTFRKAPKFFDVVTWTGNATNRTIAHALGQEVGLIFVKRTDTTADWQVYHRSLANTEYMVLNSPALKATGATRWNSTTATTSNISLGTDATVNASGGAYVAYLFAHDTTADGIIQCGSFTTDSAGISASINLGWECQYLMVKRTNDASDWAVYDASRGFGNPPYNNKPLYPNATNAEGDPSVGVEPEATGFKANGLLGSSAYIYLAIRRPNKPPTTGTQVYKGVLHSNAGASPVSVTGSGFSPDLSITTNRNAGYGSLFNDKLRGADKVLVPFNTTAETTGLGGTTLLNFLMDGAAYGTSAYVNGSTSEQYIHHFFRRAPGFFDVVCYTGTGSNRTVNHSLGVAPELVIVKLRGSAQSWHVFGSVLPGGYGTASSNPILYLNLTNAVATGYPGLTAAPTSSLLSLDQSYLSPSGYTYVAYLFASLPGISKVGSYTGNGSSQTINCGFSAGARFVLIKRTDSTGDWFVWDTARGIVSANDPHLSLNTSVIEVTTNDSVDPDSTGFIVNQVTATNINVTSATYIFLAVS